MTNAFFGGISFDQDVTGVGRKESEGEQKMLETASMRENENSINRRKLVC